MASAPTPEVPCGIYVTRKVCRFAGVGWRLAVAALLLAAPSAFAREHLLRMLDSRRGLEIAWVTGIAEDDRGFLWMGTTGGLKRYDGVEIQSWAVDSLGNRYIHLIRTARDGSVYAIDRPLHLFQVKGETVTPVCDDAGRPLEQVTDVEVEDDGTLWAIVGHQVRYRGASGGWRGPVPGLTDVRLIRKRGDGVLFVASLHEVWQVSADGAPRRAAKVAGDLADVLPMADGSLRGATYQGDILEMDGSGSRPLLSLGTRAIGLVQRGPVLWASFDQFLVAFRPGQPPEVLGRDQGIPSGGPMIVDHEGSLWMATFEGALQLPEPETSVLNEGDGLLGGPRYIVGTDEGMWVTTWRGLSHISLPSQTGDIEADYVARAQMCLDGRANLWTSDEKGFLVRKDRRFTRYPYPDADDGDPAGCSTARDGGVWLGLTASLFHASTPDARPEKVPAPDENAQLDVVHEDDRGRLWVTRRELICQAESKLPIHAGSWKCQRIPGIVEVRALRETEAGTLWAGTVQGGVLRYDEASGRWTTVDGSLHLPSRVVLGLSRSPRGGTWVVGDGFVIRVLDRPGLPDGWEIIESLGAWNGLVDAQTEDLLESSDGSLWIVQNAGVNFVPAEARMARPGRPRIALIDARVDGRRQPLSGTLDLPYRTNRLELAFSALSYRDPLLVRYRVRVNGGAWGEPTRQASVQFVDLPPGRYRAEVQASLDGRTWSDSPARLSFRVLRPWYLQPWAVGLFIAALAALLYAVYRIRVAVVLRMERQRARIAMDLHDEIGSALGSIGILASLTSDGKVGATERESIAAKIAETAEDLGESLGDIVWSLRAGSTSLDSLAGYLAERGRRLFPEERPAFTTGFPDPMPAVPLSLHVCRALQRIALEALHNAAKHADATTVELGISPSGRGWKLWVRDDGIGLSADAPRLRNGGLGVANMKRRAEEIEAELTIESAPDRGTRIAVTFNPAAKEAPLLRASHGRAREPDV